MLNQVSTFPPIGQVTRSRHCQEERKSALALTISQRLEELVQTGENLVPRAGSYFAPVDARLQLDYLAWRTAGIEAVRELAEPAYHLVRELQSDSRGKCFHTASASRMLGVLKAARFIASKSDKSPGVAPA